jgi:hypothetical protein
VTTPGRSWKVSQGTALDWVGRHLTGVSGCLVQTRVKVRTRLTAEAVVGGVLGSLEQPEAHVRGAGRLHDHVQHCLRVLSGAGVDQDNVVVREVGHRPGVTVSMYREGTTTSVNVLKLRYENRGC